MLNYLISTELTYFFFVRERYYLCCPFYSVMLFFSLLNILILFDLLRFSFFVKFMSYYKTFILFTCVAHLTSSASAAASVIQLIIRFPRIKIFPRS